MCLQCALPPGLRDVQGSQQNTGGAASQEQPAALPAPCIPNIAGVRRGQEPQPGSSASSGFPLQVRRAQHTVHSETKYIELAVVNDHQLVSRGFPGLRGRRGVGLAPPNPTWPLVCPQFLQLRKSVVLTSNFAKSVVNLADMVRGESPEGICPWEGLSLGGLIPSI